MWGDVECGVRVCVVWSEGVGGCGVSVWGCGVRVCGGVE